MSTIDLEVFRELQANAGADFVAELVDTFLVEAPGMLVALREAHSAGHGDALRRAAHSLKSNALTFGAAALAAQARAIELDGLGNDDARASAAIAVLTDTYRQAAAALRELSDA